MVLNLNRFYKQNKFTIFCIIFISILSLLYFFLIKAKSTNIKLLNWYKFAGEKEERRTLELFKSLLGKSVNKFREIRIYSVFKELVPFKKEKDVLTIQYSGEAYNKDPNLFDINIIAGDNTQTNIISMPYIFSTMFINELNMSNFTTARKFTPNVHNKFCLFAVSNPENEKRTEFFKQLSKYKTVESCGKVMNNVGHLCPGNHGANEFCSYISKYKFMICFENSSVKNYFTEKLLNAFNCGSIPIYWGCPNVDDFINMSSILYLKPDYTKDDLTQLLKEIEILDNNDELFKQKYESIFFKDGVIPDAFNIDILREKTEVLITNKLARV